MNDEPLKTNIFLFIVHRLLSWGVRSACSPYGAFRKIDFLLASSAGMFPVKLVRKDLEGLSTVGAFAGEGCEVFKLFKTRAMQRRAHKKDLLL